MSPLCMIVQDETLPNRPLVRRERTITGTSVRSGREGKMDLGTLGSFLCFASQEALPLNIILENPVQMFMLGDRRYPTVEGEAHKGVISVYIKLCGQFRHNQRRQGRIQRAGSKTL